MSKPDDDNSADELDRRPVKPHRFWQDVIVVQDAKIAAMERAGRVITDDVRARIKYVADVLLHGNCSGRYNPTIDLPVPFSLLDIEAIIGPPDDTTPGSDVAWRRVRKHFDAGQGGAGRSGG